LKGSKISSTVWTYIATIVAKLSMHALSRIIHRKFITQFKQRNDASLYKDVQPAIVSCKLSNTTRIAGH